MVNSPTKEDDAALQQVLPSDLAEKLSRWISVRYAAATRAFSASDPDPEKELRHLRHISQLVLALRRGEFNAGRLAIQQQRLTLELSNTAEAREKEHWEWTKRPDIQAKLYPNTDPDEIRRNVVCMIDRELLGVRPAAQTEETDAPASLI